jgi:hypothetical protein
MLERKYFLTAWQKCWLKDKTAKKFILGCGCSSGVDDIRPKNN